MLGSKSKTHLYRAFGTRGRLKPDAGRPSLSGSQISGSQIQQPTSNHQARKAAIIERAHRRRLYTQSRRNQHRREKRAAQRVSDWDAYKAISENQFDRLRKALTDPVAILDLLVPEDRKEMEFVSFAKSTALTQAHNLSHELLQSNLEDFCPYLLDLPCYPSKGVVK